MVNFLIPMQVQPESTVQELAEKKVKKKQAKKVQIRELVEAKEVEEILHLINAAEFGPGETTMRELATVGLLLRDGMTVDEVGTRFSLNTTFKKVMAHTLIVSHTL